jgi:hypothetical protein
MHDEANPAITADRSGLASCSGLQHSEDKSALHGAITYVCHRDRRHDWCWHLRRRQRRGTHSNCLFTSYTAGGMVITQAPLTCTAVTGDRRRREECSWLVVRVLASSTWAMLAIVLIPSRRGRDK